MMISESSLFASLLVADRPGGPAGLPQARVPGPSGAGPRSGGLSWPFLLTGSSGTPGPACR
jgi:hypothetical protein